MNIYTDEDLYIEGFNGLSQLSCLQILQIVITDRVTNNRVKTSSVLQRL